MIDYEKSAAIWYRQSRVDSANSTDWPRRVDGRMVIILHAPPPGYSASSPIIPSRTSMP